MQGFLNLNKSAGFTSHDCVAKVRRLLRLKRVGHGGTLDPMATGVLPIALGRATRLLQYMTSDKAYQATIRLGVKTTTDDLEGDIVATASASGLTLETVIPLLQKFQGKIEQVPPMYSAVQVQGKRLYELARAGKTAEIPRRQVEVYQIEVLDWRPGELAELDVAIACGAGTYIRSIARDLGEVLKTGGTLASLIRTQSSGFTLDNSLSLEELAAQVQAETFTPIPPEAALEHLGKVTLSPDEASRWCQGQRIKAEGRGQQIEGDNNGINKQNINQDASTDSAANIRRVHHEDGRFLGITQVIESEGEVLLAPKMVLLTLCALS
ncbi:MAG: tRNA pseudouridine(55) synthase TruB [Coleofasciculus sp. B1-GNL1-01]|uniref:tRNA pseudouridine(55) synthase TruB n=1 Tax=Coleofasciculus sp. B1-GNL1-01 TaxID=3068484 RepID=UPI003301F214